MSGTNFKCDDCANKRTPMCAACTVVTAPDGTVSKPKYFVRLSSEKLHIMDQSAARELLGDTHEPIDDIRCYIKESADRALPIPVALVMRYNKILEQSAAGDKICQE